LIPHQNGRGCDHRIIEAAIRALRDVYERYGFGVAPPAIRVLRKGSVIRTPVGIIPEGIGPSDVVPYYIFEIEPLWHGGLVGTFYGQQARYMGKVVAYLDSNGAHAGAPQPSLASCAPEQHPMRTKFGTS
jgi:hypothetical protein